MADGYDEYVKIGENSDELLKGEAPGCGDNAIIVAADSFENISIDDYHNELRTHPSGTISQIVRSYSVEEDGSSLGLGQTSDSDKPFESTDDESIKNNNDQDKDSKKRSITPTITASEIDVLDVQSEEWKNKDLHIFILSEAGKPIYSRYGKEDKLVTIIGVMQALVSFVQDSNDHLRSIIAGDNKFVFLIRDHILLVAVSRTSESTSQLAQRLTYVYNEIVSILTYSQLAKIFKQRQNYDLRRLLSGAEKFIDNILNLMDHDPCYMLCAVRCLPLQSATRYTIAQTVAHYAKVKDLVFAVLLAKNQLVTLVRMKKYFLHPVDLHLIINLVSASESFKAAESWSPICLPKFDSSGYLHAHVSYLDEECNSCLLLLTVDRDMFFTLSDCKRKIMHKLNKLQCLKAINDSLSQKGYSTVQVGIPDLRHFMYKSRSTAQFTSPDFDAPYHSQAEQFRVFRLYQYLHHRLHNPARPLKILYHVGEYETLLGWVTTGFELYAVFGPLVTKSIAINSVNKLLKWIKKEEERLFILNAPTF